MIEDQKRSDFRERGEELRTRSTDTKKEEEAKNLGCAASILFAFFFMVVVGLPWSYAEAWLVRRVWVQHFSDLAAPWSLTRIALALLVFSLMRARHRTSTTNDVKGLELMKDIGMFYVTWFAMLTVIAVLSEVTQ